MQIGELSERTGRPTKTLRYWEERGLLPEPLRGPNGYRDYHEDAIRVVRFIGAAKSAGLRLEEIAQILAHTRRRRCTVCPRHLAASPPSCRGDDADPRTRGGEVRPRRSPRDRREIRSIFLHRQRHLRTGVVRDGERPDALPTSLIATSRASNMGSGTYPLGSAFLKRLVRHLGPTLLDRVGPNVSDHRLLANPERYPCFLVISRTRDPRGSPHRSPPSTALVI
ncbi:MAG: MerR family transcriptional regulator [Acidimicrobiales bacterium]